MHRAATTYDEVLNQVRQLNPTQQARLLEELAGLVRQHAAAERRRSFLELEGLGQEIWEGIDAQEYVRRERAAWTG